MQVLQVDVKNPQDEVIQRAARVLQLGGLVVYPTETLYGLGANIIDLGAIQRVFEVKGRFHQKPISIAFRDIEHAERYAHFTPAARKLAEVFLPGPLTMILPAKINLGEMFGGEKIAVRVSNHKVVQAIMSKVKFPITATSANISGKADPICAQDSIDQIGEKVDLVLDSGKCEHSMPSTVVDLSEGKIVIVRQGVIPKSRIINFEETLRD